MKVYVYYLLLVLFVSCSSAFKLKKGVNFHFTAAKKGLFFYSLKLNSDETFTYTAVGDLTSVKSAGVWTVHKDKLQLRSFDSYKNGYFLLKELVNEGDRYREKYCITIVDTTNYPILGAIADYEQNVFTTGEDGKIFFQKGDDSLFRVQLLGHYYCLNLNMVRSRNIQMKIIPFDNGNFFFNNELWEVRRNLIISKSQISFRMKL